MQRTNFGSLDLKEFFNLVDWGSIVRRLSPYINTSLQAVELSKKLSIDTTLWSVFMDSHFSDGEIVIGDQSFNLGKYTDYVIKNPKVGLFLTVAYYPEGGDVSTKYARHIIASEFLEAISKLVSFQDFPNVRPAFGYPTLPEHKDKLKVLQLLHLEDKVELTESYMINPPTSICGLVINTQQ